MDVRTEEKDGKTLRVLSELYPSKEALDAGAADVMGETFQQLDGLLAIDVQRVRLGGNAL